MKNPSTFVALMTYGGVEPEAVGCMVRDCSFAATLAAEARHGNGSGWKMTYQGPHGDALVDRSRAMVVKFFMESDQVKDHEVLVMIDHDMSWQGPTPEYEGDLLHVARKAWEMKSIVGAVISKKTRGEGIASMLQAETVNIGSDELIPAWYMGAGFTAYHRDVVRAVYESMCEVGPGFRPVWLPIVVPHPVDGKPLHLSEDWAMSYRAAELGYRSWAASKPIITHWGRYGFTVIGDSQPAAKPPQTEQEARADAEKYPALVGGPQMISLLYATRGREGVAENIRRWRELASGDHNLEVIVSTDDDDPVGQKSVFQDETVRLITGHNRGNVDAYNRAAYLSSGDVLVQVHDDVTPPKNWDQLIIDRIGNVKADALLLVSDGVPEHVNNKPWLPTVCVVTRSYAKRVGGMWFPEYASVFCDDDLGLKAKQDGVVIAAQDIVFKHDWAGPERDETQKRSYRAENWEHGQRVLNERRASGFKDAPEKWGRL